MKETLMLALIQLESVLGDPEKTGIKAERMIREAAGKGAELIVLPELYSTGYNLNIIGHRIRELQEGLDGPTVTQIRNLAKELKVHILAPIALYEDQPMDKPYNSSVLVDDQGEILGTYAKCHLYGREREFFTQGEELKVFDTALGKIGIMICYDAGFPETARILRRLGADLILCPSAWNYNDLYVWDANMPQRALENVCYLAAVNRYGHEGDLYMGGHSLVVGPDSRTIARLGEEEGILYAALDGRVMDKMNETGGPYLHYRRPELYRKYEDLSC